MRMLEKYPEFRDMVLDGGPVLVDVSSAAEWYLCESPQDVWDMSEDFHSLTLPSQFTYMEFVIPPSVNRNGVMEKTGVFSGKAISCLASCWEIEESRRLSAQSQYLLEAIVEHPAKLVNKDLNGFDSDGWKDQRANGIVSGVTPRFVLDVLVFLDAGTKAEPLIRVCMYLDENGKAYPRELGTMVVIPLQSWMVGNNGNTLLVSDLLPQFMPFAFAISLMNCKNVHLLDGMSHRSRQEKRRMEREGKPFVSYKLLHIKQLQERVSSDMVRPKRGGYNRLHFVRAHWATYSADNLLFGKYEGTFFKPSHVRGKLSSGVIFKDYKVDKP